MQGKLVSETGQCVLKVRSDTFFIKLTQADIDTLISILTTKQYASGNITKYDPITGEVII